MNNSDRSNKSSTDTLYYKALNNALNQGYSPDRAREEAQRAVRDYWLGNSEVEEEEEY